jgi:hypothetical protein
MPFAKNPLLDGVPGVIHLAAQGLIVVVQFGPLSKTSGSPAIYAAFANDGDVF